MRSPSFAPGPGLKLVVLMAGLAFFLAAPAPAQSQAQPQPQAEVQAQPKPLNLNDVVKMVLDVSPKVRQSEYDVEAAKARLGLAERDWFPTVSGQYGYTYTTPLQRLYTSKDQFGWKLQVTQNLFAGFATQITQKLRELGVEEKTYALDNQRLSIALSAKEHYFSLLLAEKTRLVAEEAVRALQSQVEVARNYYEVGMSPKNDLLQAEVDLANSQQDLIKAVNNVSLAKAQLNRDLRRDVNAPISVLDAMEIYPPMPKFQDSIGVAMKERPDLKQAFKTVEQAEKNVDLARSEYYPSVDLAAGYARASDDISALSPGVNNAEAATLSVTLTWKLYDFGRRGFKVQEQMSNLGRSRQALVDIQDLINLEIKQRILNLEENRAQIDVSKKAIEQAEESFRMAQERYKEQVATTQEVLDSRSRLSRSRGNYYNALYGFHVSLHRLQAAMGRI